MAPRHVLFQVSMILSENRLPPSDQVRGQAFSGSCSGLSQKLQELAAFAAVEQDAGKTLWQMIEQFDPGVAAERRPRLDHRVEAAGRVHQQRRPGAERFVARRHAVNRDRGHAALPLYISAAESGGTNAR